MHGTVLVLYAIVDAIRSCWVISMNQTILTNKRNLIQICLTQFSHNNREAIRLICDEMGHFHQSQNDFLDVFNIDGVLIKTGHDIEIGKCSWLSATCMELANDEQKQIMVENYGKPGTKYSL